MSNNSSDNHVLDRNNIDITTIQKMMFIYNALQDGWTVKKIRDQKYEFIKDNNNNIEITTGHEMNGYEHYIIKHMLFDESFNLIREIMFNPENDSPISNHDISQLKNKIYALSLCNKHDAWLNAYNI